MAVRADNASSNTKTYSLSHAVVLPVSWNDATANPKMDCDKWLDRFQVAMMPKYFIPITELTREVSQQDPSVRPLRGILMKTLQTRRVLA